MSKYQEALSNYFTAKLQFDNEMYKSMELLEELVDTYPEYLELKAKATPKKIVYREFMKLTPGHEYKESCPNCNSVFDYDELGKKHCSNCGQAILWK